MSDTDIYRDRWEAGRILAAHVRADDVGVDPIVLALPRGGVPVGYEVAEALAAPLDLVLVRKLGLPRHPEVAIGAIASGGVRLLNRCLIVDEGVTDAEMAEVTARESRELGRREGHYRAGRPAPDVIGRAVVVVDDGLATGFTMRAAVAALRQRQCAEITVAAPVGARSTCEELAAEVERVVCPRQLKDFRAVGEWYMDFSAVTDEEVKACLQRAGWDKTIGASTRAGGGDR